MDATEEGPSEGGRHDRLLGGLYRMVESGRVTEQEADQLRGAAEPGEFDGAVVGIRVRHATAIVDAAVGDGSMTQQEADDVLGRLRRGEHGDALRAQIRSLRRRARSRSKTLGTDGPGDVPRRDTPA